MERINKGESRVMEKKDEIYLSGLTWRSLLVIIME